MGFMEETSKLHEELGGQIGTILRSDDRFFFSILQMQGQFRYYIDWCKRS